MRLGILFLCWHLFFVAVCNAREITHEDIKDAMLSLVHMMRENTEKLERHEVRERQLGDQLKKTIAVLTKRVTSIDGLKTQLLSLEEKVNGIEQLITQRDERERIQMQKTADMLEDLENRLDGWFTDIDGKLANIDKLQDAFNSSRNDTNSLMDKLNAQEAQYFSLIASVETRFKGMMKDLDSKVTSELKQLDDVTKKIQDLETKILDGLENVKNIQSAQQNQKCNTVDDKNQTETLHAIHNMLQKTKDNMNELPGLNDIRALHNETRTIVQEAKHNIIDSTVQGTENVQNRMVADKEETKSDFDALRLDLANNAENFKQELRDLGKGQSVMISMADHVLDTKKRVEYGIHQILLEMGDLVKAQSTNINHTLNTRFDEIYKDIMKNQNGALGNLTIKMEHEMNQVWRQINVMYQQMTESAKALEKLHEQNEAYVNGTTTTMGGMENKVGEITKGMMEVDENLNYLLGRLSLVTQEFNQIKTGLGSALDNIKASFKEVQEKANSLSHPGPHPIPENYTEYSEPPKEPSSENSSNIYTPSTN